MSRYYPKSQRKQVVYTTEGQTVKGWRVWLDGTLVKGLLFKDDQKARAWAMKQPAKRFYVRPQFTRGTLKRQIVYTDEHGNMHIEDF